MSRFEGVFLRLHWNTVRVSPCILANAGDLPGDFDVRLVRLDGEGVVGDLRSDPRLCRLANRRELIAEVAVRASNHSGSSTTAWPLSSVVTLPS